MSFRIDKSGQQQSKLSAAAYYEGRNGYKGPYAEYERLIMNHIQPGKSMLDVGCGRTFPLAQKWLSTGGNIYGIDPVVEPESVIPGVDTVQSSAEKVPFPDEKFDLIASCAVLEHLENPLSVFNEFKRLLKPGGKIVLLTPSKYDYVSVVATLIPNKFHGSIVHSTEGRAEEDTFPTYYRANSYKQLKKLTKKCGLIMISFNYLDQSPYSLRFSPFLYKIGCMYHWVARTIKSLNFLNGWILCVLEKPSNYQNNLFKCFLSWPEKYFIYKKPC